MGLAHGLERREAVLGGPAAVAGFLEMPPRRVEAGSCRGEKRAGVGGGRPALVHERRGPRPALLELREREAEAVDEQGGVALAVRGLGGACPRGEKVAPRALAARRHVGLAGRHLGERVRRGSGGRRGLGERRLRLFPGPHGAAGLLDEPAVVGFRFPALRLEQLLARGGFLGLARGRRDGGLGGEERLSRARERVARLADGALVLVGDAAGLRDLRLEPGEVRERHGLGVRRRLEGRLASGEAGPQAVGAQPRELLLLPREEIGLLFPARGARGLPLQRGARAVDLRDDVREAQEVSARLLELHLGLTLADLVLRDAGGLLDEPAAILRLRREDQVDLLLLDDRVRAHAEAGAEEDLLHVLEARPLSVEDVVALAVARDASRDDDLAARFGPLLAAARLERQRDLRHPERPPARGPVEDDVLHRRAAQALRRLLAEHPLHGVADVGLAGAVRADDRRDARRKRDGGLVHEGLEALDLESLQSEHQRLFTRSGLFGRDATTCRAYHYILRCRRPGDSTGWGFAADRGAASRAFRRPDREPTPSFEKTCLR